MAESRDNSAAVVRALARRDIDQLRILARTGGFGDSALRRRVWPILLGVEEEGLENGDGLAPASPPPSYSQLDTTPSPTPPTLSPASTRPSTPHGLDDSFIQANSSLDESVTSLGFGSPSASLASLPPLPPSPSTDGWDAFPPPAAKEEPAVDWGLFKDLGAEQLPKHVDENQIQLDTRRSFVVYPAVSQPQRERLQLQLHAMLLTVFRRHPTLRYFQGYHDIASVFLLTFIPLQVLLAGPALPTPTSSTLSTPPTSRSSSVRRPPRSRLTSTDQADQLPEEELKERVEALTACVERMSLYRIRDGMGVGLEPVMGLLRVINRVLRAADPALAKIVNQASPLPFFALSWLLTLFSHDVDSEPIIQLVFDFLLSNNPIMAVYLTVSIVLAKRPVIEQLQPSLQDDPGVLHTTLSYLPVFIPSPGAQAPEARRSSSQDHLPSEVLEQPPLALTDLFAASQALYGRFPPNSNDVRISDFMGPRSVVFTYEEEQQGQPMTQDEAEHVVGDLDAMVCALPPMDDPFSDDDDDEGLGKEKKKGRCGRPARPSVVGLPSVNWSAVVAVALFAGAISIAMYNTTAGTPGRSSGGAGWAEGGRRLGELAGIGGIVLDGLLGNARA